MKGRKIRKTRLNIKIKKTTKISFSDTEQLLHSLVLDQSKEKSSARASLIAKIIYNSTASMKNIAYNAGCSLGKDAYFGAKQKGAETLLNILKDGGMGDALYNPFEDSFVITATPKYDKGAIHGRLHSFEAGIMSGYLTAHLGKQVSIKETQCIYDGDLHCRFFGRVGENFEEEKVDCNPGNTVSRIIQAINSNTENNVSQYYLFAELAPLLCEPLSHELSNLFYLTGAKLASSEDENAIPNMLHSLDGVEKVKINKYKGVERSINIKYRPIASNAKFINFSLSMLSGFVKNKYDADLQVNRKFEKNSYFVDLKII